MMLLLFAGLGLLIAAGVPYVIYLLLGLIVDTSAPPISKREGTPPVSILIPTYNEEAIVEDTLERLCNISYPDEMLEIVVIDSSDDQTANRVCRFFKHRDTPSLTLIKEEERGGVARAVNRGVEAASHDLIFRTDCDSRLHSDAVCHAVETLNNPDVGAVTGRQTEVLGNSDVEQSYRNLQARNQALESALDSTFIVHGPCFAFNRAHFEPIAEDSLADDTEIALGIRRAGKRVVMDPAMHFVEAGTSHIRERRKRKDRRAMGLLQLCDRNWDLLGRHGLFGWVIFPFNLWFLVISPWLSISGGLLILLGLLTTVPPLGLFAVIGFGLFVMMGQRDLLGPLQAPYAVFDSHLSLVIARIRLQREESDGTWSVDLSSRDQLQ